MGTLLRYPYEVRNEKDYFDDIQDVKVTKDMLDSPSNRRAEIRLLEPDISRPLQAALIDLINRSASACDRRQGRAQDCGNVIQFDGRVEAQPDEREAGGARRSGKTKGKKARSASKGQREMLLPISRQAGSERRAKKGRQPVRTPARRRSELAPDYFSNESPGERAIERRADAVDRGEDHDRKAGRDQGVFDRRRARLIRQEFPNQRAFQTPVSSLPAIYPAAMSRQQCRSWLVVDAV